MTNNYMRKGLRTAVRARLGSVAALSAALWFGGCESQPLGPWENVRVELFVSHNEPVLPGDTLLVRLVATNTSRWPLELGGCRKFFRIRDNANEVVPVTEDGCLLGRISAIPLAPGRSVELVSVWTGKIVRNSMPGRSMLMPPGEYQLEGFLPIDDLNVISAPVTIRVRAPE